MRVPVPLSRAFDAGFEALLSEFLLARELLPEAGALSSDRFLSRSVAPHVKRLSELFTRRGKPLETREVEPGIERYWERGSNPEHLRLGYFLSFMPVNLYRVAAIFAELGRLGFRWPEKLPLRAVEFGAGPASGACGVAAGDFFGGTGLPRHGSWALIEQSKATLELGAAWADEFFGWEKWGEPYAWETRKFHRTLSLEQGLLPRTAPKFSLMLSSFVLNEFVEEPAVVARALHECWSRHLDEDGLAVLVEPALKLESRRLLKIREELIKLWAGRDEFKILLPCLGEQRCGALHPPDAKKDAEDWCHEEVSWWRPPYFKKLDELTGLDRKSLPMSYLVIARSRRVRAEILPALAPTKPESTVRLVSPSHGEGRDEEFFYCGQDGKRRARFRNPASQPLERGDILFGVVSRGDVNSARIESIAGRLPEEGLPPHEQD